jgi:DNA-binding transcriptional LysR family regulator
MQVTPADLATFLAIARHRSFRAASVELGVSASALSHAMRNIEDRLGLRLFNRTTRSVALTEAGGRLFTRITPAFRDISDALDDLNTFRGKPAGTLRLNTARQAAHLVLLPLVTTFLRAYPDVKVELATDDALVDMVSAGFDAGIRFGETIAADMIAVPIGPRHRFAVVASPDYFKDRKKPVTPHDLSTLPCIRFRFTSGNYYRWEFERGGMDIAIEVDGPLTLNDQDLMLQAALDGVGLAYVFEAQATNLIKQKKLVRVLADWCPAYPGFFLYYPSRRQLPSALRAFIDFTRGKRS